MCPSYLLLGNLLQLWVRRRCRMMTVPGLSGLRMTVGGSLRCRRPLRSREALLRIRRERRVALWWGPWRWPTRTLEARLRVPVRP